VNDAPADQRSRGGFGPVVLIGVASAALLTVAAGRTWATATPEPGASGPLEGMADAAVTGADVAPLALPLGLVALAAWGAVLVLRRRGRRMVSILGLLATLAAAVTAAMLAHTAPDVAQRELGDVSAELATTVWPFVTIAAAAVGALAFVIAWRASPDWPEMSSRYDAPSGADAAGDADAPAGGPDDTRSLWKALDEGRDPTR
jgi:uncharacterized membrane protein (TIGR02234 family)